LEPAKEQAFAGSDWMPVMFRRKNKYGLLRHWQIHKKDKALEVPD
jgi:hypothetical protein